MKEFSLSNLTRFEKLGQIFSVRSGTENFKYLGFTSIQMLMARNEERTAFYQGYSLDNGSSNASYIFSKLKVAFLDFLSITDALVKKDLACRSDGIHCLFSALQLGTYAESLNRDYPYRGKFEINDLLVDLQTPDLKLIFIDVKAPHFSKSVPPVVYKYLEKSIMHAVAIDEAFVKQEYLYPDALYFDSRKTYMFLLEYFNDKASSFIDPANLWMDSAIIFFPPI